VGWYFARVMDDVQVLDDGVVLVTEALLFVSLGLVVLQLLVVM
jgi:hypothetical protein